MKFNNSNAKRLKKEKQGELREIQNIVTTWLVSNNWSGMGAMEKTATELAKNVKKGGSKAREKFSSRTVRYNSSHTVITKSNL